LQFFLKGFIQPASLNQYLKETRGRWLPVMMSNIKSNAYWQDPSDPHRPIAVETGLIKPSIPWWMSYNPAYAAVLAEQLCATDRGQHHAKKHDARAGSRDRHQRRQDHF
jgi:hypothetical protein